MRVAYTNLIDNLVASNFTVIGTATGFDITHVQEQRLSVRYRTLTPTAQSIIMNFGTAQTVTTAAILGHNISASATASSIILSGCNDGSTWSSITTITRNANAMLKFTSATNQYFKFSIDDPLNTDGYIEIGRLWLGVYEQINPSSLLNFTVIKKRSDMVTYGKNRQKYATPGEDWRGFELSFPATGGSMLTSIITMFDSVGKHSSFIFCNFDDLTNHELVYPCYVSVTDDMSFNHTNRQKYNWSISMEENK
jgi:hypothetical protein